MNQPQRKTRLQLPRGAESLLLEEAFVHRRVIATIADLFTAWGYMPIQTPVLDFFDGYRQLLDDDDARHTYRLVDREGELLMLRADVTLFMAKQIGLAIRSMDLPLRVCYFDAILRHQEGGDLSHSEFYQVGAELVGLAGVEADLESLALLNRLLEELRLPRAVIHLGSRALVDAYTGDESVRARLRKGILARDWQQVENELGTQVGARARELFAYVASGAEFLADAAQLAKGQPPTVAVDLERTAHIVATLLPMLPVDRLRVDLSEVGSRHYHTGLAFSVYLPGVGSAVAAGGRYDRLFAAFGDGAPAAGFSLFLRKVEGAMQDRERFLPPTERVRIPTDDFAAAYRHAEKLRAAGQVVIFS